jgi:hypothetical protein
VGEGTAWAAFVPVIGGYLKTHWCVVVTTCPACGALPGEPCMGAQRKKRSQTAQTHYVRRALAQKMKQDPKVRAKLLRAMPAVAFALDSLEAAFGPERGGPKMTPAPVVRGRAR